MTTRTIKLLAGAHNIEIDKDLTNDKITTIVFDCPAYPTRKCIHQIQNRWKIRKIVKNKVTLIPDINLIKLVLKKTNSNN